MKKIGILTFFNTVNYGASLQTLALAKKIEELGSECEVIRYHCNSIEKKELVSFPKMESNIINYLKNIIRYIRKSNKRKKFKCFLSQNISLSKNEYNKKNIKSSNDFYDKFIVGSDMVFELGKTDGDTTYYLDFADENKRYSYAASLGGREISDTYIYTCINNLKKFQKLSVREEQAKEYLSKYIEKDIRVDLDPTLLHDKNFWKKYEEKPKDYKDEEYILIYFLDKNGIELKTAKKIAKEKNWKIKVITSAKTTIEGCEVIYNASVEEFLYYIHHAKLVITGSFHGMALSVNFNTNYMYYNEGKPLIRLDNLAKLTDSKDRKIEENYIPKIECDFNKINASIEKYRKESIEYLKSIIDD